MSPRTAAVADADCRICRHTVVAVHGADAPHRSLADIKQDIAAQFRLALSDLSVTVHGERQYLVRFEDPAVRVMGCTGKVLLSLLESTGCFLPGIVI
jgi:hypothetical protein